MRFIDEILCSSEVDEEYKKFLDGITIIEASNVARYYFQESTQEVWYMKEDFPNVAPPFEKFYIDCQAPERIMSHEVGVTPWKSNMPSKWGIACVGTPLDTEEGRSLFLGNPALKRYSTHLEPFLDQARWGLDCSLDMCQNGKLFESAWMWRFLVRGQGDFLTLPDGKLLMISAPANTVSHEVVDHMEQELGDREQALMDLYTSFLPYLHVGLLAISFMHCHNVSLDDVVPALKRVHNKSAKRRGEKDYQPAPYKVLNIQPMRQVLKGEGQEAKNGTVMALHICRGHFKHYEKGRGLFGKYKGTYWFPDNVRGSKARGVITKDYVILPPE